MINRGNAEEKIFKSQRREGEEIRITSKQMKKHKRDIQLSENNDDLNKTIQIFLREVGKKY